MPTTPFSIIWQNQNPAGIKTPKGTPAQRVDLETLWRTIADQSRIEPPTDPESWPQWKGRTFDILLDVKSQWAARDVPADKMAGENYIIIDVDHIQQEDIAAIRKALASSPFCVFSAQSATYGVWALYRAKVPEKSHWQALKSHVKALIAYALDYRYTGKTIENWIDESTLSHGRPRYLAPDPEAIKGPAYANAEACFDLAAEASDAVMISSPLYELGRRMDIALVRARGVEGVCRSSGLAYALAGVATAAPFQAWLDLGFKRESYCGNLSAIIAAPSNSGKSYGLNTILKPALRTTPAAIAELDPHTPQALMRRLSQLSTTKTDGVLELNGEYPAVLVSRDEAGAIRADDKKMGIGIGTLDAYTRKAIDGEVQAMEAAGTMADIYPGPIPFFGAFIQASTNEAAARSLEGDDPNDGRGRRTFYFVQEPFTEAENANKDCVPQPNEADDRGYVAAALAQVATVGKVKFRRQVVCSGAAAANLYYTNGLQDDKSDGALCQQCLRIAAANAILSGRCEVNQSDVAIALRIWRYQLASVSAIQNYRTFNTKNENLKWTELLRNYLSEKKEGVTGDVLRKQRWMNTCPLFANTGKVSLRDLWNEKLIQPINNEELEIKNLKKMRWVAFDEDNPILNPEILNTAVSDNNNIKTADKETPMQPRRRKSPEERKAAYITASIEGMAGDLAQTPEGHRHDTFVDKCAAITPNLIDYGISIREGLEALAAEAHAAGFTLPQGETQDIVDHFVNSKGNKQTTMPSKGYLNAARR